MIHEKSFTLGRFLYVWHCLICGEIYDPVIVINRLRQQANTSIHARKGRLVPLSEEIFPVMKKKPVDFSSL
jgi:hypothetical protein